MVMSSPAAHGRALDDLRLGRYLPLSVAVTLAVVALPVLAVAQLGPARGPLAVALHVVLAVALSMALARALALLWSRHQHSSDLVFGDLLLWGWARRVWAERRLEALSRSLSGPAKPGEDRGTLLRRLSSLLEQRDPYTHGHSKRVARHAERIARRMGLEPEQVARVRAAALVHDIGKINIPRSVLAKPGRLTDAEFALVKRHAADGAVMVAELGDLELAAIVRHHHERLDGRGYPDGLAGGDVPLGARIIAVADTFDAITSARPYRRRRTHKEALEVVRQEAGTQLDADAVEAFSGYYGARGSVGWAAVLLAAPQRLLSGLGGVPSGVAAGAGPLAQTACGVGVAALIGACFGAPAASEPEREAKPPPAFAGAPVIADRGHGAAPAAAAGPQGPAEAPRGSSDVAAGGEPRAPRERATPRALETPPAPTSEGNPSPGSGAAPGVAEVLPETPDVPPGVPPPDDALDPVTDLLPPGVDVPQLEVPQLHVPQLQVPQLQVPAPLVELP
jgi:putative nucleotidyltransferase with HDIG domain